jgi:hypothetical protein
MRTDAAAADPLGRGVTGGVMSSTPPLPSNPGLVSRALQIREEVERFNGRWTPLPASGQRLSFTWEELERQLVDLAPSELQAELVRRLVERCRLFAELKPSEMVLREVLCVAALVLDEAQIDPGAPAT